MTLLLIDAPSRLVLPPAFTLRGARPPVDAHTRACRLAASGEAEAATLVMAEGGDRIDLALVLAPAEPLATARRALFVGMRALADAVGTYGPPEIPVTFGWPDILMFNGARLGGARLGWPEACGQAQVPDWLVFSAMLIVSKRRAGDPGLTPDSTSLEEEGFPAGLREPLVESFARHVTKGFEIWNEDGFERVAARYLAHLGTEPGTKAAIGPDGDLRIAYRNGRQERLPLLPALQAPAWLDRSTGTVRL